MNNRLPQRRTFITFHWLSTLILSLAIIATIWTIYFPGRVFFWGGGAIGSGLLLLCSLTLGPVISSVLYKPEKKGLCIDLLIVCTLQISAITYATYRLLLATPECIVLDKNTIHLITKKEFDVRGKVCPKTSTAPAYFYLDLPKDKELAKLIRSMSKTVDQMPFHFRTDLYIASESINDLPTSELSTLHYKSAFGEGLVFEKK